MGSNVTGTSSPADLASQIVAGVVSGTLALYKFDRIEDPLAEQNIALSHRLFQSALYSPTLYTNAENITSLPVGDHYPSNSYLDDLFWASTWLLRASLDDYGGFPNKNSTHLAFYYAACRTTFELAYAERDSMAVSLDYLNNVALVHAAVITKDWSFHSAAQSWIWDWICSGAVRYTVFGRAHHPESMMLGDTVMAASIAATYVHAARQWGPAELNDYFLTGTASPFQSFFRCVSQCHVDPLRSGSCVSLCIVWAHWICLCRLPLLRRGSGAPATRRQLPQAAAHRLQLARLQAVMAPGRVVPQLPLPVRSIRSDDRRRQRAPPQWRPAVAPRLPGLHLGPPRTGCKRHCRVLGQQRRCAPPLRCTCTPCRDKCVHGLPARAGSADPAPGVPV